MLRRNPSTKATRKDSATQKNIQLAQKKTYKKCSVKGCRGRALRDGKCRKHAKLLLAAVIVKKESSALHVKDVVSRIKKLSAAHHESVKEIRLKDKFSTGMKRKQKTACCSHKGYLNVVCFWAGTLLNDATACFRPQTAE